MNSNTHSTRAGDGPVVLAPAVAALAAAVDALAAEDRSRLSEVARAERVLVLRRSLDRLEGHWLQELAAVDARGAAGADQGVQAASTTSWLRVRPRLGASAATAAVRTAWAVFRGPLTRSPASRPATPTAALVGTRGWRPGCGPLRRCSRRPLGGAPTQPLAVGRTSRVVTPAQRVALAVRDGGCGFPECGRPPAWCEAHHVRHWLHGGPTGLANLALLCRAHHRAVHGGCWQLTRGPGGRWMATPPHRQHHTAA